MKVVLTCTLCKEEFRAEAPLYRRGGYSEPDRGFSIYSPLDTGDCDFEPVCEPCEKALISAIKAKAKELGKKRK